MVEDKFKLDKNDKKILMALEENSRYSNKTIARITSLNEHVVAYRIKRMFDSGLVKKICCVIGRGSIYPVGYRIFLRFQNISAEKEKELINRGVKNKFVCYIGGVVGHWDMLISIFVSDPKQFMEEYNKIVLGFEDFIQEKEIVNYLEIVDFNRTYLHGAEPNEMLEYDGKFKDTKLDDVDKKLLSQLADNSRQTLIELSNKTNVSPDTVKNRISRLEKEKVILGHAIFFDYEKLGINYYVVLLNLRNVMEKREKEFRNFCLQHKNITYWIKTIGSYDLNIEIESTEKEMHEIISKIREKFGDIIKNIEILNANKAYKYSYFKD